MADFQIAYNLTMNIEGGYANKPNDHGGETYAGISRVNFPLWTGWQIIDSLKGAGFPANLKGNQPLSDKIRAFYKQEFWDVMRMDEISQQFIATEMFDMSVNCGVKTAVMFLQRSLNILNNKGTKYPDIATDGVVGPAVVKTMNNHPNPINVLKCLVALQGARYILLGEHNPTQEEFMNGWINRAFEQFKLSA